MMTRLFVCLLVATLLVVNDAQTQAVQLVNAFPNLRFTKPLHLTHSPDTSDRIFVVQEDGLIMVFPNDSAVTSASVFLNIANKISSNGGEEGLLGLAFHPDFSSNGYFYVNYTAPSPLRTVIARFSLLPGNPNKGDSLSEYRILEINQPYTNHNGGSVEFGPDGYLYIGMGDGGWANDPENRAQDRTELLGKFLRIDIDDTTATRRYTIPSDNPFAGNTQGYREEIWAWGVRNPFKFSFDPVSGQLWAGDVGQWDREEIDLIQRGGNYGWRVMEGNICNPNLTGCDTAGLMLIPPVKDYSHSLGNVVTGGHVYRGYRRPNLVGAYVYADFGTGRMWMFRYQNGQLTSDSLLIDTPYLISSFGIDQDRELYICTFSYSETTPIYRFAGNSNGVEGEDPLNPLGFRLEQNYPNPFNPTTTIAYQLPERSNVVLRVFDMLGREIAVLVDGFQTRGRKEVQFDASSHPSGVYFYRLSAGSLSQTRRMVVLK